MEGTVITKKGIQLLAKVIANKNMLNITRAAVGTGKLLNGYDPSGMIGLVEYKMDAAISKCSASGDTATITIQVSSDGIQKGFIITEIGIFAEDLDEGEILYAYVDLSDDPQYIYPEGGEAIKFVEITLDIIIAEGTRVTAFINPSSMVKREEFEEHAKADNPHGIGPEKIGLGNVDNTADADKPVSKPQQDALDAVKRLLNDIITDHLNDTSNPHKADKNQVGLNNADNTSDMDKPVSIAQQAALDALYEQLTAYTRQKIADLINGAPGNLDTLKEVSDAIAAHKTVMDALNEAIGKKANAAEFDSHTKDTTKHITAAERTKWNDADTKKHIHDNKSVLDGVTSTLIDKWNSAVTHITDSVKHITAAERTKWNAKMESTGDSANNTLTFTSGDAASPTGWANIDVIATGEKHSSLFRKMSLAVKNLRYLYKLIGTTNISEIGGGTLTGAINSLNTGMKTVVSSAYITGDYIKSEDLSAQRDGNHVKVSGGLKLAKAIPNAGNTVIGKIYTPSTPLADVYFLLVTPTGGFCLAYMSSEADIVVCNYLGADIAVGTNLYIIGLEWFFNSN